MQIKMHNILLHDQNFCNAVGKDVGNLLYVGITHNPKLHLWIYPSKKAESGNSDVLSSSHRHSPFIPTVKMSEQPTDDYRVTEK